MDKKTALPSHWEIKKMTEVVTWGSGGTPKATEKSYYENGTKVKLGDPKITKERAIELFKNTVEKYEKAVNELIKVKLTQNQFNALVSFTYNVGISALKVSTLLKKVNANPSDETIKNEFEKWVNAGGKQVQGLLNRRKKEVEMYFSK